VDICESSIYSIEQGVTSYTPNKGLPVLRETLSNYLKEHYNLSYNSDDEIIITSGVSEALDIAIRAIVDRVMKYLSPSRAMSLMLPVLPWREAGQFLLNVTNPTGSNLIPMHSRKRSPGKQKHS